MGTDIFFFAEECDPHGKWSPRDELIRNPDFYPDEPECASTPITIPSEIELDRCYDFFAIIADVRNGMRCEGGFSPPISKDRGLPDNVSAPLREYRDSFGDEAFGDGWTTPHELQNYDWSRIIQKKAMVPDEAAALFKDNPLGFPFHDWPQNVPIMESEWSNVGVEVRWRETYAEAAGLDAIRETLGPYLASDIVRFVFWFA